jgi:hypothetical protein
MNRFLFAPALILVTSATALAQDMPLSQILIDGEEWKKVRPAVIPPPSPPQGDFPYTALSPDGRTVYLCSPTASFIEAGEWDRRKTPFPFQVRGSPYCPLRVTRGERKIEVTGLAVDKDGRIYAGTPLGVQVFDPTGRLCGVLTPAAPGIPRDLVFEGDKLTLIIDGEKYSRKLNTTGVK